MAKSEIHLGRTAEAPSILDFIALAGVSRLRLSLRVVPLLVPLVVPSRNAAV
ncbi:hypothetical protein PQR11_21820 [Paraburkholderia strydomiana]|uniref:hypothetical protein n=1 Tax=Paraburkholderia strydomiana TaxID=1245417 RepID=UPI0038BA031E